MAALDFPDSPTTGQVYDKWTWNGTMWVLTAAGGGGGGGSGFTFNQDTTPTATKVGDTWFETDTGDSFVWTNDGNSTQWVQFAPGSGGGGGSGFTYVSDTAPTPSKAGDTWFDLSTAASGGTSWVAVSAVPGAAGPLKWVQFAPGAGASVTTQAHSSAAGSLGGFPAGAYTYPTTGAGFILDYMATRPPMLAANGTTAYAGQYTITSHFSFVPTDNGLVTLYLSFGSQGYAGGGLAVYGGISHTVTEYLAAGVPIKWSLYRNPASGGLTSSSIRFLISYQPAAAV